MKSYLPKCTTRTHTPPPHSHTHMRPQTLDHRVRMSSLSFLYFSLVFNILYKFSRLNHASKFYSVEMHFPSLPDVMLPLKLCHLPVLHAWSQKGVNSVNLYESRPLASPNRQTIAKLTSEYILLPC